MCESIEWFKRSENLSRNLNWKKNIGEGMKMFQKYQLAIWLSIQNFYKSNSQMWVFWSYCRALSNKLQCYFSHGPNKAFLVPDSCRATVRNYNSVSMNVIEDTIENNKNNSCLCALQTIWQLFWTFWNCRIAQLMYIVSKY
jgi:hypothetical protein